VQPPDHVCSSLTEAAQWILMEEEVS
jgi:hypothetical protein